MHTPQRRLFETAAGTRPAAFGITEWGLLVAIASIWGSSFLFMEVGLRALPPAVITTLRILLGALTLGLVPRARRPVPRSELSRIVVLGWTWMAVPLLLFPIAQQWIDSALAGMLNGAMPLMTALVAALLFRQPPRAQQVAGLVVGFGGVAAISVPALHGVDATALGTALVLVAVTCYGIAANLAVPLQQRYGALPVLLRAQLVALVTVLPAGLWQLPAARWDGVSLLAMVPLGVLGTGLAFVAMTVLVGRAGAARGAVAIYFVPVVAILLGVTVLGERVGPTALLGTALVVVGAWITSRAEAPR